MRTSRKLGAYLQVDNVAAPQYLRMSTQSSSSGASGQVKIDQSFQLSARVAGNKRPNLLVYVVALGEALMALSVHFWDRLGKDLRYGLRMLLGRPGFMAVAVLSIALGIAATTAIFSVVYAVLIDPYPYRAADRIGGLHLSSKKKPESGRCLFQSPVPRDQITHALYGRRRCI
jgi:hypothetical protein